jgi:hypothetical protein
MVAELQFVAVAGFLIWGLASSLCQLFMPKVDEAALVRRGRETQPPEPRGMTR